MENTTQNTAEKITTETVFLADCAWNKNPQVKTEFTRFEISGSHGYGNGRHPETFKNLGDAIEFAKTKKAFPNSEHNDYWNNQSEVITKVTVITEIVRIVRPEEKR